MSHATPPPIVTAYKHQQAAETAAFSKAMTAANWIVVADLFGNRSFWQHKNGRVIPHEKATDYYQISGQTPAPF